MANGNNRAQKQPRAHFQLAGGSIMKFRHPYFAGQVDTVTKFVDEIDVSACCKLEGKFFSATQNQDSAKQVVLVDGSVVTVTNKLLNGTITIPAIKTTGMLATGDFISACQLLKSTGDKVGGLFTKTDFISGKAITKMYYGVTVKSCPDDESEGNDVPIYDVQLLYAGWIEAVSTSMADNKSRIWAVGTESGLEAYYNPYSTQNSDGTGGTEDDPLSITNSGIPNSSLADDTSADYNYNTADGITEATVFAGTWANGNLITDVTKIEPVTTTPAP